MRFRLTPHAEEEIQRRLIPRELLDSVLQNPEQVIAKPGVRKVYQSKIDFGRGKIYLLRAIVDDTVVPPAVITAYRTGKIDKYWRKR